MASSNSQKKFCLLHSSRPLALLTALSVAGTLLYVFVLLVPAWRIVTVDRNLIGDLLANSSSASSSLRDNASSQQLWEALARDPMLRSRSINAFRECLQHDDARFPKNKSASQESLASKVARKLNATKVSLKRHLLEVLAGAFNTSLTNNATSLVEEEEHDMLNPPKDRTLLKEDEPSDLHERCWFLNLHWSSASSSESFSRSGSSGRQLLNCIRALFMLAVFLLLCWCVCLTGALYACFAARMPPPCRLTLLGAHCFTLSLLVALAILQDRAVGLETQRLHDLLEAAGFPAGSGDAVTTTRGNVCLALLCLLCFLAAIHMLLLLLTMSPRPSNSNNNNKQTQQPGIVTGDAATAGTAEKAECDDTEDTNPLI